MLLACASDHRREEANDNEPIVSGAADAGDEVPLVEECSGDPFGQGTCPDGQICGSLPEAEFDYCMRRPPCPPGMVTVTNVACAYPCSERSDCHAHGMEHCAPNELAYLTDEARGWCTP